MEHIELAKRVSIQSLGNILLSHLSTPANARYLERAAELFDAPKNRWGVYVIEVRDYEENIHLTRPVAIMQGYYQTVLRAALCLQPVTRLLLKHRDNVEDYVHVITVPSSLESMAPITNDEPKFLSYPEFVATRHELTDRANSEFTGDDRDDQEHVKGWLYGEPGYDFLIAECGHSDLCIVRHGNFSFAEENQDEAEAVLYRCYMNAKHILSDEDLECHFDRPLRKRRVSLTY